MNSCNSDIYVDSSGQYWADKDPGDVVDYPFNWSKWLGDDVISSVEFMAVGVSVDGEEPHSPTTVYPWVRGGTVGQPASLTCRITTAGGRICEQTLNFRIVER